MAELRKYNEDTTIYFPLITRGAVDFDSTPVVHAAGDSQISIDGGAFGNTNAGFNHEGNGIYSIALSSAAGELTGRKIIVTIIDQGVKAYEDQAVSIVTFGHASAEYIWDLDNATPTVDATKISGSGPAADNVESIVLGTGAADDVDLSARSLTISQDVAATPAVLIENTNNDNAVEIAAATGNGLDIQVSVTGHAANLSGSGAARYGLNCVSVNDAGAYFEGSTAEANGEGIVIEGKGTDSGLKIIAGATGIGLDIAGGGTSGNAVDISTTDGIGLNIAVTGNSKQGAKIVGGASGTGLYVAGGTGGKGAHFESDSNTAFDVQSGTGKSMYIRTSSGSQDALTIDSDGGGGVRIESLGSVGNDYGLYIKGLGPNGHAVELVGNGAGSGIDITPGATGVGLNIAGGGTSGDGISIATTDGDGIKVVAAGTGKNAIDLSADTDGKALEINQQTKTGSEDIFELMYARLAGKNQMDNTGGSSEIEVKLSNYAETSVLKTLELKKPDGSANTEILNVNALAGEAEA
jgi:hypothetical protein